MNRQRFQRIRQVLSRRQPDLTVLMERVHKPHNLSAILRNCDAVGVLEAHAVPPEEGLDLMDGTSASASKWVPVRRHGSLESAVEHLRDGGFRIVAAHPSDTAVPWSSLDYTAPTAFLLGTELDGLTDDAVALADEVVALPMAGMVRSINVSVATALLLYEAYRQRLEAGFYDRIRLPEPLFRRLLFEWSRPRMAAVLQERGRPYPELDDEGEIVDGTPSGGTEERTESGDEGS